MSATLSFREGRVGWRSSLTLSSDCWVVDEPVALDGCAASAFEEELEEYWAVPGDLLFQFEDAPGAGKPTQVSVTFDSTDESRRERTVAGESDP